MPVPEDVWISQREATFVLQCGVGITERQARRVLAAGLAGTPQRIPGVQLYDRSLVSALVATNEITEAGWHSSPWTCVWLRSRIQRHGSFPLVATLGGFVVRAADILDATLSGVFGSPLPATG